MSREHHFETEIVWTGNKGEGTTGYEAYSRDHILKSEGKAEIILSTAPVFRGDPDKFSPEDLLVASLSSCHMLWYLHLCADSNIHVLEYSDKATGTLVMEKGGSGRFTEVTLHPVVTVAENGMVEKAVELHKLAHEKCFIANSCNFPVYHEANVLVLHH